jgi:hypothetical protein
MWSLFQAPKWRGLGFVLIAAGSLLSLGCHSARKPTAAPCVGAPYLLVRNETGQEVDVYYSQGATPYLVGRAGTGPTELTLPPNVDPNGYFRARFLDGQWIVGAFGGQRVASRITFEARCR